MCGRIYLFSDPAEVASYTGARSPTPNTEGGEMDVAPTNDLTVLIFDHAARERRQLRMKFGLIPHWAKNWKTDSVRTFNAKSETITELKSFKPTWEAGRRGLVITNGFYEWARNAQGKTGQRYAIYRTNEKFTAMACIWNVGTHDGETMHSAAIITCDPNSPLEPIHNRMPVLIAEADWPKWLGEVPATSDELRAMLRPYPSEKMSMTPVKRKMPKRGTQEDLNLFVEPLNDEEQTALLPTVPQACYGDHHGTNGVGMMRDGDRARVEAKIAKAKPTPKRANR